MLTDFLEWNEFEPTGDRKCRVKYSGIGSVKKLPVSRPARGEKPWGDRRCQWNLGHTHEGPGA